MKAVYTLKILLSGLIFIFNNTQSIQKEYYESGNLSAEGRVVDGLREGVWKSYYETGELQGEMVFSKGIVDGPIIAFHKNGNIQTRGQYKEGKKEGTMKSFYLDGSLYAKMNFRNNEYHGKYELFYPDGSLWETGSYFNGKKKGSIKTFKENGELLYEKNYTGNELSSLELLKQASKDFLESSKDIIHDTIELKEQDENEAKKKVNSIFSGVWSFLTDTSDEPVINFFRRVYDGQYNPLYWPLLCIPFILIYFARKIVDFLKKISKK